MLSWILTYIKDHQNWCFITEAVESSKYWTSPLPILFARAEMVGTEMGTRLTKRKFRKKEGVTKPKMAKVREFSV